ncbi:hypothetical protein GH714_039739 [Hevea brasiliensis]|uniref:Heat shock 70 kDa protein 17 n=1 Tax=Hevea brasiliensis TaxID=3981 RepID=A0A6A6M788_HEVBR|nr:hypothetical protein GH714_039739 [Hevea brasiliensis]
MRSLLFKLGLFLSFILLNLIPSQSAVSSVDLGSEWMKVAVVNLKPGQSPISIAINEMSKRKSPALVAFQSETRLLGEEAAGITARYPDKVYSQLRDMIGKSYKHVKEFLDSMYLPFDVVEDSRGAVGMKIDDNVTVYSVEELVAMILSYAANLAEFHSKVKAKDAVISVPPYFGQAQRRGLVQAAQLAGINVLSLINEHSGAALQYGIDKDFSNGSRYVIFYDMGSSSTYAALVYYSAYSAREFGKAVSVNQFQVKDVRWDPELGGQKMEVRLLEFFADEFNKQVGNGVDVRKSPKAMAKLKKQVKRTKEILSANTMAPISVESLYDDGDFRSSITRDKFEELCEDLWDRSLTPLKEVLNHSGLKVDEIYAVELIGGATRVPKLQAKIQEFLGRNELDKHLDADEAIVLGAALHAANLSDGIKLNRKLGMVDGSSYGFVVELDGPDLLKNESTRQLLVPRMKKLPSKMFRSIIHDKDFEVLLAYETEDFLPPGTISPIFAQYAVSGVTDASEKYSARNLSSPIKTNLHFSLSRSGILSLDRADAVIEISEWVEVPKKNLTIENTTATSPNVSIQSGANNVKDESIENLHSDGGLEISEEFQKISSHEERKSFIEKLDEVQEWLYTDGEDATATEFQDRLDSLKAIGDPIFFRYKELTARPAATEIALKYLGELQQIVQSWETKKPWLPKSGIDEVLSDADKLRSWLDEKEAEQKKTSEFSTPAFTSEELYMKVFNLQDKVAAVNKIPKPKLKVEKPKKNETETNEENLNSSNSTAENPESDKPTADSSDKSTVDSSGLDKEKVNTEPEVHDEL